jgi:CubicO group peptidase (beta-lactamase class C family)
MLETLMHALLLLLVLAHPKLAATQSVPLPHTPAARQLRAFISVFDSGKRAAIRSFVESEFEKPPGDRNFVGSFVDQQMTDFAQKGGYVIRKIVSSHSAAIRVLAQASVTGAWAELSMYITARPPDFTMAAPPYHIVGFGVRLRDAPPEFVEPRRLPDAEIRSRIGAMMQRLSSRDAFSGSVVVARAGRTMFAKAYGPANRTWNISNQVDTRFNLASITKMFTAVSVGQLVEAGKLSLDETVGEALPDYPNKEVAKQVSIRQLLSHTSGLIGGRALAEKQPESHSIRTIAEMVKQFENEPLSFPPGQQFDYSNAGFILLGLIIEHASGQTYFDYVRDHVFRPAGMQNTGIYEMDSDPKNLATGFEDGPGGKRRDNIFDLSVKGGPDGGAYSTGLDMVRFSEALLGGRLVGKKMLAQMWTGVTEEPERNNEYGFGAQISSSNGHRVIWHGGGWQGVTNEFDIIPDLDDTVVVLSNYDDDPGSIASRIREWLTQGSGPRVTSVEPAPRISLALSGSVPMVSVGQTLALTLSVSNSGGTAHASIVDLEVKDASGAKVFQRFNMGQKLDGGKSHRFVFKWTPTTSGRFTVDIGAFRPGWSSAYAFKAGALSLEVR